MLAARSLARDRAKPLPILSALAFFGLTTWNLDRFPPITQEEPWILSPGYKLFTEGVYGSDLFAGLFGMDRHYLFLPLMPLLEGAAVSILGLGVWQMRIVAALLGTTTLLLAFQLARQFAGSSGGILTLLLLLFWQWGPAGDGRWASGIPLLDFSRIARYDILTAPLGLGALLCFVVAEAEPTIFWQAS